MTLFLCGDVMLGRGVDQILPHPGRPQLQEQYVLDARDYVRLAERAHGPVPRPASFAWPWGDALDILGQMAPTARLVNLETSITHSTDFAPGKGVHYRMSPQNLPALAAARPDAIALANNHVLDFGRTGLLDTLAALASAGLRTAGAGRDATQALQPAVIPARYATLTAALTLLVGAMSLAAWLLRLGFVADLLSRPVLVGYVAGVALIMIAGQLARGYRRTDHRGKSPSDPLGRQGRSSPLPAA